MSLTPESQASKSRLQLEEYRGKFPEIPEQDLLQIVQKYASDPESCQKILEQESKKCLYGSSPTPDPPSPLKVRSRTDGVSPFDLPRSNSTGSAGSSHSSGRSTPVNVIPTPYVVPPRYPVATTAGQVVTPVHTGGLPPGTVCINGNYYQLVPSTGHVPGMPTNNPQNTSPSASVANHTSPNTGYPIYSTNGYFTTDSGRNTPKNPPISTVAPQGVGPGMSIPTGYFSPASQTQGYSTSYPVAGLFDPRYHTLPGNIPLPMISTPNMPTSSNVRPLCSTSPANRQEAATLMTDERRHLNISPNRMGVHSGQFDTRFQTNPAGNSSRQNLEPLYISTSPGMNSPEILRRLNRSGGSPEELQKALGALGVVNRQPVANDDYLRACFSHQQKRFQKLQKEYSIEKERLDIVIKDITERDGALYDMKYIVEPNPTDEQLARLSEENEKLKRTIDEISKNIDRLENGQAFLPPADPRIHDTQRLPSSPRHGRETIDRSNSVPCLRPEKGRVPPPPLSRPLSEHDIQDHLLHVNKDNVHYQIKPSHDTTLPGWDFINPTNPDPIPPANYDDDETQWSCSRCTFLNHESLTVCEICSSSRHQ
ncbi:TGF-beta-activated kinase 1 and MAP3K7-binding 3 isoform X1 [Paramuricea clavata]|uniref:TGF-beta-activated kinase 1 and MAP3K7-binding 3 isoform X1 n=1 Tax=Paramuricea clavata TaxID=317549 RepID=A0A7D9HFL3_PARCT|nr:TGF-beta-activated kinase 1 and MAP3K7-binding 3 isoform X1 [Paramuricea clavata]